MEVRITKYPKEEDWLYVKNNALNTVWKHSSEIPDYIWRRRLLASEHSPIYDLWYGWEWIGLKSWISVHFVRHHEGIVPFVSTQRNDRQDKYDRDTAPQSALVTHRASANAQAIINISKLRRCYQAHSETIAAWELFLEKLKEYDPILVSFCVPKCVYRNGLCGEFKCCGYNKSEKFKNELEIYTKNFNKG